jgi:hypothetical protein
MALSDRTKFCIGDRVRDRRTGDVGQVTDLHLLADGGLLMTVAFFMRGAIKKKITDRVAHGAVGGRWQKLTQLMPGISKDGGIRDPAKGSVSQREVSQAKNPKRPDLETRGQDPRGWNAAQGRPKEVPVDRNAARKIGRLERELDKNYEKQHGVSLYEGSNLIAHWRGVVRKLEKQLAALRQNRTPVQGAWLYGAQGVAQQAEAFRVTESMILDELAAAHARLAALSAPALDAEHQALSAELRVLQGKHGFVSIAGRERLTRGPGPGAEPGPLVRAAGGYSGPGDPGFVPRRLRARNMPEPQGTWDAAAGRVHWSPVGGAPATVRLWDPRNPPTRSVPTRPGSPPRRIPVTSPRQVGQAPEALDPETLANNLIDRVRGFGQRRQSLLEEARHERDLLGYLRRRRPNAAGQWKDNYFSDLIVRKEGITEAASQREQQIEQLLGGMKLDRNFGVRPVQTLGGLPRGQQNLWDQLTARHGSELNTVGDLFDLGRTYARRMDTRTGSAFWGSFTGLLDEAVATSESRRSRVSRMGRLDLLIDATRTQFMEVGADPVFQQRFNTALSTYDMGEKGRTEYEQLLNSSAFEGEFRPELSIGGIVEDNARRREGALLKAMGLAPDGAWHTAAPKSHAFWVKDGVTYRVEHRQTVTPVGPFSRDMPHPGLPRTAATHGMVELTPVTSTDIPLFSSTFFDSHVQQLALARRLNESGVRDLTHLEDRVAEAQWKAGLGVTHVQVRGGLTGRGEGTASVPIELMQSFLTGAPPRTLTELKNQLLGQASEAPGTVRVNEPITASERGVLRQHLQALGFADEHAFARGAAAYGSSFRAYLTRSLPAGTLEGMKGEAAEEIEHRAMTHALEELRGLPQGLSLPEMEKELARRVGAALLRRDDLRSLHSTPFSQLQEAADEGEEAETRTLEEIVDDLGGKRVYDESGQAFGTRRIMGAPELEHSLRRYYEEVEHGQGAVGLTRDRLAQRRQDRLFQAHFGEHLPRFDRSERLAEELDRQGELANRAFAVGRYLDRAKGPGRRDPELAGMVREFARDLGVEVVEHDAGAAAAWTEVRKLEKKRTAADRMIAQHERELAEATQKGDPVRIDQIRHRIRQRRELLATRTGQLADRYTAYQESLNSLHYEQFAGRFTRQAAQATAVLNNDPFTTSIGERIHFTTQTGTRLDPTSWEHVQALNSLYDLAQQGNAQELLPLGVPVELGQDSRVGLRLFTAMGDQGESYVYHKLSENTGVAFNPARPGVAIPFEGRDPVEPLLKQLEELGQVARQPDGRYTSRHTVYSQRPDGEWGLHLSPTAEWHDSREALYEALRPNQILRSVMENSLHAQGIPLASERPAQLDPLSLSLPEWEEAVASREFHPLSRKLQQGGKTVYAPIEAEGFHSLHLARIDAAASAARMREAKLTGTMGDVDLPVFRSADGTLLGHYDQGPVQAEAVIERTRDLLKRQGEFLTLDIESDIDTGAITNIAAGGHRWNADGTVSETAAAIDVATPEFWKTHKPDISGSEELEAAVRGRIQRLHDGLARDAVNPADRVIRHAGREHQIGEVLRSEADLIRQAAGFLEQQGDRTIVGHNVIFDFLKMTHRAEALGLTKESEVLRAAAGRMADTMLLEQARDPLFGSLRLEDLGNRLAGEAREETHIGRLDRALTARVLAEQARDPKDALARLSAVQRVRLEEGTLLKDLRGRRAYRVVGAVDVDQAAELFTSMGLDPGEVKHGLLVQPIDFQTGKATDQLDVLPMTTAHRFAQDLESRYQITTQEELQPWLREQIEDLAGQRVRRIMPTAIDLQALRDLNDLHARRPRHFEDLLKEELRRQYAGSADPVEVQQEMLTRFQATTSAWEKRNYRAAYNYGDAIKTGAYGGPGRMNEQLTAIGAFWDQELLEHHKPILTWLKEFVTSQNEENLNLALDQANRVWGAYTAQVAALNPFEVLADQPVEPLRQKITATVGILGKNAKGIRTARVQDTRYDLERVVRDTILHMDDTEIRGALKGTDAGEVSQLMGRLGKIRQSIANQEAPLSILDSGAGQALKRHAWATHVLPAFQAGGLAAGEQILPFEGKTFDEAVQAIHALGQHAATTEDRVQWLKPRAFDGDRAAALQVMQDELRAKSVTEADRAIRQARGESIPDAFQFSAKHGVPDAWVGRTFDDILSRGALLGREHRPLFEETLGRARSQMSPAEQQAMDTGWVDRGFDLHTLARAKSLLPDDFVLPELPVTRSAESLARLGRSFKPGILNSIGLDLGEQAAKQGSLLRQAGIAGAALGGLALWAASRTPPRDPKFAHPPTRSEGFGSSPDEVAARRERLSRQALALTPGAGLAYAAAAPRVDPGAPVSPDPARPPRPGPPPGPDSGDHHLSVERPLGRKLSVQIRATDPGGASHEELTASIHQVMGQFTGRPVEHGVQVQHGRRTFDKPALDDLAHRLLKQRPLDD